jgi:hypothetical protein
MKEITLTQGKVALVDDEDFEELIKFKWCVYKNRSTDYASHRYKNRSISMHRTILKANLGEFVDHKDGNGLNNQKSNLRICTMNGNMQNRKRYKNNTTGFKGVYFNKDRKKYRAQIRVDGKRICIGGFKTPIEAAQAYDSAAIKLHGEFAVTNFNKNI